MSTYRYPMKPGENPEDPAVIEKVVQLALDNPVPRELDEQIANWIEPETLNCDADHGDVMTCIHVAYPLIKAYMEELLW